jgi:hypothetical protein
MASQTATFATNPEFAAKLAELMTAFPEEAKQFLSAGTTTTTTTEPVAPVEKKRTKKAPRDPNLPKRPKNAFMLFTDSVREGIKERMVQESPDGKIRVAEISKHCGECWKNLTDEEKQPFVDANAEAKVEYEKAMEAYYTEFPDKKPAAKAPKAPKEPKAPKAKTGFQIDTDAEATFDANLPEGWARGVAGYLGGAVKDPETGKPMKFKTFDEAVAAANSCDCGGITRTKTAYTLRKSSTVKDSSSAEFSWTRVKGENGMSSSESDADN